MFDTVYADSQAKSSTNSKEPLTKEEFKDKYYNMIQLGNKSVKESFAVSQIQRVIQEKDYHEIDSLF